MKHLLPLVVVFCLLLAPAARAGAPECAADDTGCWIRQLNGDDKPAALHAALILGGRGAPEAVPPLVKKLESDDPYLATAALQALVHIGTPAVPDLVKATHSKKAAVRRYAAYALGKIGGQDSFAALEKAAHDPDKNVRRQTATAFGLIKDPRSVTALLELLRDRSASVRAEAATALGVVGDKRVVSPLIEYGICDLAPETAAAATDALTAIGEPAVDPLIADFNARPSYARQRILIALAKIGAADPKARDRAVKTAAWVVPRKNESGEVRAAAAFALGALDAREAAPVLKQALAETAKEAKSEDSQKVAAACRMALDKIYQRYQMPHDY